MQIEVATRQTSRSRKHQPGWSCRASDGAPDSGGLAGVGAFREMWSGFRYKLFWSRRSITFEWGEKRVGVPTRKPGSDFRDYRPKSFNFHNSAVCEER